MKTWTKSVLTLALSSTLITSVALAMAKPVKLDRTHSKIGFTAATLLFDVDGSFGKYDVKVDGNPSQPESAKISVSIDVASIDTGNKKRDDHLRAPDFFDARKYPKITFTSTRVKRVGNKLHVTGTLDMHGKKKQVNIPFKVVKGKNGAGKDTTAFKGKLTIDRNAYGVGAGSVAAKISLEDEVEIDLLLVAFI